jgi:ribosomal protein L11 methyltransferase
MDYIDENILASMGEEVMVTAWYPADGKLVDTVAFIRSRLDDLAGMGLGFDIGGLAVTTGDVRDEDWENNWKKYYKPFAVGERLMVKPVWEQVDTQDRLVIKMDPGMAFGTGTHETTFMCLEALEQAVQPGMLVWDIGCGTGILSVAAALLGAARIVAVDRDSVAVSAARINSTLNGTESAVEVREGDLMAGLTGQPDLIVANIIAEVIISMAEDAFSKLKPGGRFLCSGIIRAREEAVRSALTGAGFRVTGTKNMGEWAAITAEKPD